MKLKSALYKITGLSLDTIQYCSAESQNKIALLGGIMLFTALISAGFMSYAIAVLSFNKLLAIPVIFLIWLIFVYLFERLIVAGKNINKSSILISRILAALVFALIHSLVMDTLFFKKDIVSSFRNDKAETASVIRSGFEEKMTKDRNSIFELQAGINKLTDKISLLNEKIINEVDGTGGSYKPGFGPIYQMKKETIEPQVQSVKNLISKKEEEIQFLRNNLMKTELAMNNTISNLQEYENLGLLGNIRQLHHAILINGDFVSRLFFILWLMIFFFIESLPLLAKLTLKFPDYYDTENKIRAENKKISEIKIDNKTQAAAQKELALTANSVLKSEIESVLDKMQAQLIGIERSQHLLEDHLKSYNSKIVSMKKNYPDLTESHIIPLFNQNKKDLEVILNQINVAAS